MIRFRSRALRACAVLMAPACPVLADVQPPASSLDAVQVTATRFGEQVQEVPNAVEVISGEELRARGAYDLRTALALVGGVSVAPGGDDGPASAVPGLLGLREIDDFLLVVDGVPAGGALLPQFSTLDLNNIERIEVQRGTAPVFYGTTAFAGTIHIVHYAAGSADQRLSASYGSFGSFGLAGAGVISTGDWKQSISADATRDRYADAEQGHDRAHLLYRLGHALAGGQARLDVDATVQHDRPASPQPVEDGRIPDEDEADSNQNPADAKIDTNRFRLTAGYDKRLWLGDWGSTLSVTQSHLQQVRGFLLEDAEDLPAGEPNAEGFHQRRDITDVFFDTHLTRRFGSSVFLTVGANELFGLAHQDSQTFAYTVPADGSRPVASSEAEPEEASTFSDQRSFAGLYAQARWNLLPNLGLLAGLRLNHTDERRTFTDADDSRTQRASSTRLNGSIGLDWRVWQDESADLDDVVVYASYGNTFQPPQIDFGPEDQGGPLLRPEIEQSIEGGIKADGLDGRLSIDLSGYYVNFANQAVAVNVDGTPGLANGGKQGFRGGEIELRYTLLPTLLLSANYSYNDARYRDYQTVIEGETVQLKGKRLVLSPHGLAAAGLIYGGATGPKASVMANFVGDRFLDSENTLRAKAYATVDATLGWQFRRYGITLEASNLGNQRAPVLASELGEGQFYLLQGRRLFLRLTTRL